MGYSRLFSVMLALPLAPFLFVACFMDSPLIYWLHHLGHTKAMAVTGDNIQKLARGRTMKNKEELHAT